MDLKITKSGEGSPLMTIDFLNGCSKAYELTSKLLKGEGDCIDAYKILQTIVFGEEIYR